MKGCGSCINENGCIIRSSKSEDFSDYSQFATLLKQQKIGNLFHILENGSKTYNSNPCLGTRTILGKCVIEENGKSLEKLTLGNYNWINYEEVKRKSICIGQSLLKLGHKPKEYIVIFAETRVEWLLTAMGCFFSGIIIITLYNSLSDDALVRALNETEGRTMVTSFQLLSRILKIRHECLFLKTLIVMENDFEDINKCPEDKGSLNIIKFKDFVNIENEFTEDMKAPNNLDDTAVIMYTSGSTGIPKGVQLSHKNILASISAYPSTMHVTSSDRYLALLPLAHIMELIAEISCIAINIPILYSSPTTLTSKSPKIMKGCDGDAVVGKPTFTMVVPLVLDKIIKSVYKTVKESGPVKSCIFNVAVQIKMWLNNATFISCLLDVLLFNRIKNLLGGQLRTIGVGGSPLSEHTHSKMRAIFGCSLRVGYGTTETSACATGMEWRDNTLGHVGAPNFGIYIRLVNEDEEEVNASLRTAMHGEIHVGGDIISNGYFKRPKETEKVFYDKNDIHWFKTGDIGEVTTDGFIKIVDRKRDFIKLKHGEYVSLQKIECVYKTHMLIENICIIANPFKESVVAILTFCIDNVHLFSSIFKLAHDEKDNLKKLYARNDFVKEVWSELSRYGKEKGLNKWEIPGAIFITTDAWSPESGHLTGSFKVRRQYIKYVYESEIKKLMDKLE